MNKTILIMCMSMNVLQASQPPSTEEIHNAVNVLHRTTEFLLLQAHQQRAAILKDSLHRIDSSVANWSAIAQPFVLMSHYPGSTLIGGLLGAQACTSLRIFQKMCKPFFVTASPEDLKDDDLAKLKKLEKLENRIFYLFLGVGILGGSIAGAQFGHQIDKGLLDSFENMSSILTSKLLTPSA